ncbi:hypothetical protein BC828DRAFT_376125 [Blastocladiella britannica]|nr:hypothetical protein BC828DRAFT_376125 [Blastocladiella britannica]
MSSILVIMALATMGQVALAAWPKGMQSTFWNPAVVYLPDHSKAYIFGGRSSTLPIAPFLLSDVAVIQFNQRINFTDRATAAVNPAPFSLPSPEYTMLALVDQQSVGSDVYNVALLAGIAGSGSSSGPTLPPPRAYLTRHLLQAGGDGSAAAGMQLSAPTVPAPWSALDNPCWSATATPLVSGAPESLPWDPAAYLFGNWSTLNDELLRFKRDGTLETVIPATNVRPPPRGWGSLVRWNMSTLLLAGGNPAVANDAPKLGDIWLYNLPRNTWTPYPYPMPDPRDDFQTVTVPFPDPSSSRKYAVFIGNSASSLINYAEIDAMTAPVRPAAPIGASPSGQYTSASRTAAMAAFYHDHHIFLVGGLNTGVPSSTPMAAIKVTAAGGGGNGLGFQWVDEYVPSAASLTDGGTNGGTDGGSGLRGVSSGAWIAILLTIALVLGGAAGVVIWRMRANAHSVLKPDCQPDPCPHESTPTRSASSEHSGASTVVNVHDADRSPLPPVNNNTTRDPASASFLSPMGTAVPPPPDLSPMLAIWMQQQRHQQQQLQRLSSSSMSSSQWQMQMPLPPFGQRPRDVDGVSLTDYLPAVPLPPGHHQYRGLVDDSGDDSRVPLAGSAASIWSEPRFTLPDATLQHAFPTAGSAAASKTTMKRVGERE